MAAVEPLRVGCYLGDNARSILAALVALAAEAGAPPMRVVSSDAPTSTEARRDSPDCDIVWMCGALTETLIEVGALDHEIVAAPIFADGTTGAGASADRRATYHSVIVTRAGDRIDLGDPGRATVAINERDSWSGHMALRRFLGGAWFETEMVTGSHLGSVAAVASGEADIAAIDHSIWFALLTRADPQTHGLQVIGCTDQAPSPPVSIHRRVDPASADALGRVLLTIEPGMIKGLDRFVPTDRTPYRTMRLL